MKREDTRLPWCSMGLISHFPALTVNTLLFPPALLTWTCDLPLVSDDTPMVPCSRLPWPGPGLVIHRLLDRLPQRIDFCFPPISRREANKRLKTLSVWSWIRILHRGDTWERGGSQLRFVYLFIGLTLPWPAILLWGKEKAQECCWIWKKRGGIGNRFIGSRREIKGEMF